MGTWLFGHGHLDLSCDVVLPAANDVITGQQIREARKLLGWTPLTLARKANIQLATLNRAELLDEGITAVRAKKIQRALESAGVEFIAEIGGGPEVRLRRG